MFKIKVLSFARGAMMAGVALGICSSASYGSTLINYTTSIAPDSAGDYVGVANMFYLPYTASNGNVTVVAGPTSVNAGSFITDTFSASHQPAVSATGIVLTIDASIGATNFAPISFFGSITNPAANMYCLDFSSTSNGSVSGSSCGSGSSTTIATQSFDNNQFLVEVPSLMMINAPTKTTNLQVAFAPVATPEPASMGCVGLALFGVGAFALRRKANAGK